MTISNQTMLSLLYDISATLVSFILFKHYIKNDILTMLSTKHKNAIIP